MASAKAERTPAGEKAGARGGRCARCGAPLTKENTSQTTGYCDPCQAQIEGEIRNQKPL